MASARECELSLVPTLLQETYNYAKTLLEAATAYPGDAGQPGRMRSGKGLACMPGFCVVERLASA